MLAIFKNIWNTSATKSYHPVSLLFVINKFFEKLVNNTLVDHLEKFGFNLISSMTSGLIIQLQFWQEFWQDLAHWYSLKFDTLQSRCKCDQGSDFGQQLRAWSGLLISFNLFHLTSQDQTKDSLMYKWISLILMKNHPMMPGLPFSSKLCWGFYSLSIAKAAS